MRESLPRYNYNLLHSVVNPVMRSVHRAIAEATVETTRGIEIEMRKKIIHELKVIK